MGLALREKPVVENSLVVLTLQIAAQHLRIGVECVGRTGTQLPQAVILAHQKLLQDTLGAGDRHYAAALKHVEEVLLRRRTDEALQSRAMGALGPPPMHAGIEKVQT